MGKGEMKAPNRRHDEYADGTSGWQIVWKMGMPVLYILAFVTGLTGVICNGIISHYWSSVLTPMCFLYSKTASTNLGFTFGSAVSVCQWVTYGAVAGIVLLFGSGLIYFIKVRSKERRNFSLSVLLMTIVLTTVMLLAVSCTLAEGMRISCAAMGLNSANNKGTNCYDQLEQRVQQYTLPVSTSAMVQTAMYSLWASTTFSFIITWFHFATYFRSYQ